MESLARACSTPIIARLLSRVDRASYYAVTNLFEDYLYWRNQTQRYIKEHQSNFSSELYVDDCEVTVFKLDEYMNKSAHISTSAYVWKERYMYTTKQSERICADRQVNLDDMCYILFIESNDSDQRQSSVLAEILRTRRVTESVLIDAINLFAHGIQLSRILNKDVIGCIDPDFILFISYLAYKRYPVSKQTAINAICVRHEDVTRCIQYTENVSVELLTEEQFDKDQFCDLQYCEYQTEEVWLKNTIKIFAMYIKVAQPSPLSDSCIVIDDQILKAHAESIDQNTKNFYFAALVKHELFHRADILLRAGADFICLYLDVKLFTESSYMYLIERRVGKDLILPTALSQNTTLVRYSKRLATAMASAGYDTFPLIQHFDTKDYYLTHMIEHVNDRNEDRVLSYIFDLYLLGAVRALSVARVKNVLHNDETQQFYYRPSKWVLILCKELEQSSENCTMIVGNKLVNTDPMHMLKQKIARDIITKLLSTYY